MSQFPTTLCLFTYRFPSLCTILELFERRCFSAIIYRRRFHIYISSTLCGVKEYYHIALGSLWLVLWRWTACVFVCDVWDFYIVYYIVSFNFDLSRCIDNGARRAWTINWKPISCVTLVVAATAPVVWAMSTIYLLYCTNELYMNCTNNKFKETQRN